MNKELKPCPFCGSDGIIRETQLPHWKKKYKVECSNKDCLIAMIMYVNDTKNDAINMWNRRVSDE